jgi:hypothetical protein
MVLIRLSPCLRLFGAHGAARLGDQSVRVNQDHRVSPTADLFHSKQWRYATRGCGGSTRATAAAGSPAESGYLRTSVAPAL